MPSIVISDTSTLILFHKINEFDLLQKVYGELLTTIEIAEEFGEHLPYWIRIKSARDKKYQRILETQLDKGEASALALATEFEDVLVLLNDLKARKLAAKLNLKVTGVLGVIYKAKEIRVIEKIKPLIDKLLITNFRISNEIIEELLRLSNEL